MQATLDRIDSPEGFIHDPSLVLYLPLYRLDGASFMSKDAYGHLCTVSGALWRPDGRYLDGVDDKIDCGNDSSLGASATELTTEVWMNLSAIPTGGYHAMVQKDNQYVFMVELSGAIARLKSLILKDDSIYQYLSDSVNSLEVGQWYHVVQWFQRPNHRIYVNGNLAVAATFDNNLNTAAATLWLGYYGSYFFNGLLGEVRIYSRALTVTEIQRNYLATKWRYK